MSPTRCSSCQRLSVDMLTKGHKKCPVHTCAIGIICVLYLTFIRTAGNGVNVVQASLKEIM